MKFALNIKKFQNLKTHIYLQSPLNLWILRFIKTLDKYHTAGDCTSRSSTTEKCRELCQGKQKCVLNANYNVFSDPCPYVIKQLRIWYQCVSTPGLIY